jgi:hypothetical protein
MARHKLMVKRCNVEIAQAKRTCRFTGSDIPKGTLCLVIFDGPRDRSCYSKEIGKEMLKLARSRLDEIEKALFPQ